MDAEQGINTIKNTVMIEYEHIEGTMAAKARALKLSALDNLVERSGDFLAHRHFKLYERLHLRYLDFRMRQVLWKGVLFDPSYYRAYRENTNGPSAVLYKASPDEPLLLSTISRLLS